MAESEEVTPGYVAASETGVCRCGGVSSGHVGARRAGRELDLHVDRVSVVRAQPAHTRGVTPVRAVVQGTSVPDRQSRPAANKRTTLSRNRLITVSLSIMWE